MALVDYDSSEESDQGVQPKSMQPSAKSKPSNKAIPKLVDSSNPGKIRVGVGAVTSKEDADGQESERPIKRAKLGASGLNDFNSLLPAPKRPIASNGGRGPGLGRGVNLKTGATPGFSREPMVEEDQRSHQDTSGHADEVAPSSNGTETGSNDAVVGGPQIPSDSAAPPELSRKKATIFKPLSVSRKPQKKKEKPPTRAPDPSTTATPHSRPAPPSREAREASSLFSLAPEPEDHTPPAISHPTAHKTYQPILYQPDPVLPPTESPATAEASTPSDHPPPAEEQDQSLEAIATSLNLTPSQKRQLLGGRRRSQKSASSQPQAIKVTNFNTDAEYASNEALRQSGEAVQHQPVRAITGGGKHSLKQLVNSAVGQQDALDRSFAEGTRNRKEGAAKYGW